MSASISFAQPQKSIDFLKTIRCLVCDGQSIYDSETVFSQNLREQIMLKFEDGKSENEIIIELVSIYGEDIAFMPKKNRYVLWYLPFIFLFSIFLFIRKRFKKINY